MTSGSKYLGPTLFGVLLCVHSAEAAKSPVMLAPVSKWYVNYGNDSCRLERDFGSEKDKVTVIIERFGPGDSFQLSLVGNAFRKRDNSDPARIQFGPTETTQKVNYFAGEVGKGTHALILRSKVRIAEYSKKELEYLEAAQWNTRVAFEDLGQEREAAVTYLEVSLALVPRVVLQTGSLGKPFEELRRCTDDLMSTWGVDPVKYAKMKKPVTPTSAPATWITSAEYPIAAVAKGQRAIVNFRLSVDETGKATACHIQQSTNADAFNQVVCNALMRRARFEPACDESGKPMASFYRSTVIFNV